MCLFDTCRKKRDTRCQIYLLRRYWKYRLFRHVSFRMIQKELCFRNLSYLLADTKSIFQKRYLIRLETHHTFWIVRNDACRKQNYTFSIVPVNIFNTLCIVFSTCIEMRDTFSVVRNETCLNERYLEYRAGENIWYLQYRLLRHVSKNSFRIVRNDIFRNEPYFLYHLHDTSRN